MSARLKIAVLTLLLVLPTASRLRASDDPTTPPPSAEKKHQKKKRVVVQSPERIVIDDDGVFVEGDGDEDAVIADLHGLDEELPRALRLHGFGGGYIGVQPIDMTEELREHFGAPKDAGVLIGRVNADEPAAKAGLRVGDILTAVDGAKIASTRDLVRAIRQKKEGDTVSVSVLRDRAAKTLTVAVAERPDRGMQLGDTDGMRRFYRFHTPRPPRAPLPPELESPEFRQRMDEFEKRLQELESRLPKKQNL